MNNLVDIAEQRTDVGSNFSMKIFRHRGWHGGIGDKEIYQIIIWTSIAMQTIVIHTVLDEKNK